MNLVSENQPVKKFFDKCWIELIYSIQVIIVYITLDILTKPDNNLVDPENNLANPENNLVDPENNLAEPAKPIWYLSSIIIFGVGLTLLIIASYIEISVDRAVKATISQFNINIGILYLEWLKYVNDRPSDTFDQLAMFCMFCMVIPYIYYAIFRTHRSIPDNIRISYNPV